MALALPSPVGGQESGVDISYGRWWADGVPVETYGASYSTPWFGAFSYGLGFFHHDERQALLDRTLTGGVVSLALWRDGAGLYLVGGMGLGIRHADGNVDAAWSAGAGYALRPLSFLSLAVEARYRVEDRHLRGFWRLAELDRSGFSVEARLAIGGPRRTGAPQPRRPGSDPFRPPARSEIERAASAAGVSRESARLAADVVATALDAMGTPYRWGGSDASGYDCSGLIQYAYAEHGILLPRVSRDQARMGTLVEHAVEALQPGDILAFSVNGGGVSHVGLYVGDGSFIHSSSSGVRLSTLDGTDGDSRYWRQRWVEVRRILN